MNKVPSMAGCPGLKWRRRKTGWEARWQCRQDLVTRGFLPKSRRLWFGAFGTEPSEGEVAYVADVCTRLQDEMLVWGRGGVPQLGTFSGTLNSLIECYQTDRHSNYRKLEYSTRCYYETLCARLKKDLGHFEIADLKVRNIIDWHSGFVESGKVPMGHALVGMLRTLLSFGTAILEDAQCMRLSQFMSKQRFPMGKQRNERLTTEQAVLIRKGAHADGKPSIALAQAFQSDLMLRQKDVIGAYVPMSETVMSYVLVGNAKWIKGIDWREVDQNLVLRHITSKRKKLLVIDLHLAPMVMEELNLQFSDWNGDRARLPAEGPIVIREGFGAPWAEDEFRRHWRRIADRMGIPKKVRNMDSRAGAITEADEAGAPLDDIRKAATHSQVAMTQRYSRGEEEAVARVLTMRTAHRVNKSGI